MEEKKLTDEEIVKALECCGELDNCFDCPIMVEMKRRNFICREVVLDLIHRLQAQNAEYERKLTDGELVSKEWHDEQVGHAELVIEEQKAEIERLKEDRNQLALCNKGLQDGINEYQADNAELGRKNAELQKQVDELKDERENMQAEILRFEDMKFTQEHCDLYDENEALKQWLKRLNADLEYEKNWGKIQAKQAEKDTAKEILGVILAKEFEKGDYLTDDELHELFKERYGVEVE
jgi:chromosome segregation ATPase